MSERKNKLSEIIEQVRTKKGLTHKQLYNGIDMDKSTYYNTRRQKHDWKQVEAIKIAQVLEVDYKEVFGSFFGDDAFTDNLLSEPLTQYGKQEKNLHEELHQVYRRLTSSYEREMLLMKLLAKNKIDIPE